MRDGHWPAGAYAAEFADERQFAGAVATLRDQGYSKLETYTPYPVARVDALLSERPSVLPPIVFFAGIAGAALGYWIQWFANAVSYPLDIGGRPAHAAPAFFIPTFEATVLAASLAAFFGLFALLRLPRPWHPMFEAEGFERASIDHFWVAIDATDSRSDRTMMRQTLEELGPLRVVDVPGDA
jgi:ActD protein